MKRLIPQTKNRSPKEKRESEIPYDPRKGITPNTEFLTQPKHIFYVPLEKENKENEEGDI